MSYSVQSLLLEDYELWSLDGSENNNIITQLGFREFIEFVNRTSSTFN